MQWADRIDEVYQVAPPAYFSDGGAARQHGEGGGSALAVSQPVVSKSIADMEYVLGVRLLDRTARGVEPTLYGRAMLKWAVVAFDDLSQSIKEIEFLADPSTGELRLGAPEGMMGGLLPAVIDHISRRHPRIVFHVMHSPSVIAQYQELRERRVELIIGRAPRRAAEDDIDVDELFSERLFVVAGSGSPIAGAAE